MEYLGTSTLIKQLIASSSHSIEISYFYLVAIVLGNKHVYVRNSDNMK